MSVLRHLAVLLSIFALSVPLCADELHLANGDRFTGTVQRLAGGTLTFKTPHGDLQLPWGEVTLLRTDEPVLVTIGGGAPNVVLLDTSGGDVPLSDILAIERPQPPLSLTGGASAGFLTTTGNSDISSLRLDGELVARRRHDRYTTTAVLNRGEDSGRESVRNASGSLRYDRFLSERFFLNGSVILAHDRFRELDLRTAVGAGVGYQVWDTPAARLSVEGGVGYVKENFALSPDNSYTALREATKLELFFADRRVQAFHHQDMYFGPAGDDNLFLRMQNGVRLSVVGGFVTTAQMDLDYDRSPAPGRGTTDRSFALTFGYRF
jgi:putative salt-induced outer membrane protein YdiY